MPFVMLKLVLCGRSRGVTEAHMRSSAHPRALSASAARVVLVLCAALLGTSCLRQEVHSTATPVTIAPGDQWRALTVGTSRREFLLHIPAHWPPAQTVPLVIVLHGTHGDADDMVERTGMNDASEKRNFVVAYPNGTGFLKFLTWNVGGNCCGSALKAEADDVAFVRSIIADLRQYAWVNASRVYVAGFSDGGMLAFKLACELSDQVSAIGVVAGRMPDIACKPRRPVPLIIFTGTKDPDVNTDFDRYITAQSHSYARGVDSTLGFWAQLNGCEAIPLHTVEGRHVRQTWRRCRARSRIVSYAVTDAVHEWPRTMRDSNDTGDVRDLSTTEHMLDFFGTRTLARAARGTAAPARRSPVDTVSARQSRTTGLGAP
jgi:polyhydroxybutyrate depolymerase